MSILDVRIGRAGLWLVSLLFFVGSFFGLSTHVDAATITEIKPAVPVSLRIHDTDLLVEGCASPNSLVTIINDSTVVGSVSSDITGAYSQILTAQTPTIHVIETYFEDPDNRKSDSTNDLIALAVKALTTLTANPPPTVEHLPNSVELGQNITFRGYTCSNATVQVVIDNNLTLTTVADASGLWTITINSLNFSQGVHVYTVVASGSGYTTSQSQKYQFSVIPQNVTDPDPTVSVPTSASEEADISIPVEITEPTDGHRTNVRDVIVSGTGPPNAQIELYVDGKLAGSVFSNAFGEWSLILSVLGTHQELSARACNSLGCGDLSNVVKVFYGLDGGVSAGSQPSECSLKISLGQYRFSRLPLNKGIDLSITIEGADPRFDVITDWGDTTIDHMTLDKHSLKLHHTYNSNGYFNGTVAIQNENGKCKDVVYFSTRVTDASDGNRFFWYVIGAFSLFTVYLYVANSKNNMK